VAAEPESHDREWFVPLAFIVLIETLLWYAAYRAGYAEHPVVVTYGSIALTFFTLALSWKAVLLLYRERPERPIHRLVGAAIENRERIVLAACGSILLALGSAAFGSLKAGIPKVVPFWFDLPESRLEDWLFGGHPAVLLDPRIPWVLPFLDRIYATFVGVHLLAVLAVLASKPSREKSRALVSLGLAWLTMGIIGAYLCSSVGPIFYDRVYGGHKFAALTELLRQHAPITTFTADALWAIQQTGVPVIANGISAFPSMHVTLTCWLALVLKRTRFAAFGWAYLGLIWIGSILLGWHWGFGGVVGGLGMTGLWHLAPRLLFIKKEEQAESAAVPADAGAVSAEAVGVRPLRADFR
jgi:hypothetical protein